MDFLVTAVFVSEESEECAEFGGAVLVHCNPDSNFERSTVRFVPAKDLRAENKTLSPQGFGFDKDGVLLSDTRCRKDFSPTLAEYLSTAFTSRSNAPADLVDVVMWGAATDASVVVMQDGANILVPFSTFRVSESSLNIYAPYQKGDGSFRTVSLVDVETNTSKSFFVSPGANRDIPPKLRHVVKPSLVHEGLYEVTAPLTDTAIYGGEAYINFLAYHVARCRIGLKIIDAFLAEVRDSVKVAADEERVYDRKKPLKNISIQCTLKEPKISAVLAAASDSDKLRALCLEDEECAITAYWVQRIVNEATVIGTTDPDCESTTAAAALSVRHFCKKQLLWYSLELLAQRVYLCSANPCEDHLRTDIKGGGVNGYSIKRTSW